MKRLKQMRKARNLSQEALAKSVGVSRTAIAQYETGVRRPTGDIIVQVARVLGVSSAYLLEHTDDPTRDDRLPDDWRQTVELAISKGLTPEEVQRAIRMLELALGRGEGNSPER